MSRLQVMILWQLAEFVRNKDNDAGVSRPILDVMLARLDCKYGTYRNAVSELLKVGLIESVQPGGGNHPAEYVFGARDRFLRHKQRDTDPAPFCDTELPIYDTDPSPICDTETGDTLLSSKDSSIDDDDQSINQSEFVKTLRAAGERAGIKGNWTTKHATDAANLEAKYPGLGAAHAKAIIERTVNREKPGKSWPYVLKVAVTVVERDPPRMDPRSDEFIHWYTRKQEERGNR